MGITAGIDFSIATVTTIPTPITTTSVSATKKVLLTATLMNVTGTNLVGRKALVLQNNSLNAMYISNVNTVTKETGILLTSGTSMQLDYDPLVDVDCYAIATGVPASVSLMEV